MVHHEGMPQVFKTQETPPPAPRMTMAERLQKRLDADRVATALEASAEAPKRMTMEERLKQRLGLTGPAEADPVAKEAVEQPVEKSEAQVEQAVETQNEEDAERERAILYRNHAMKLRAKKMAEQQELLEARKRLQSLPAAPQPYAASVRSAERQKPPMPRIDKFQKINIPGFGEAMILSVDADSETMYFATPEERRRVDAALVKDEGQSSMGAANFQEVIALTPDQVRQILAKGQQNVEAAPLAEEKPAEQTPNNQQHLRGRYAA